MKLFKKKAEPMVSVPYFKFNTSNNPFAYIRCDDDINIFIAYIKGYIKELESFDKKLENPVLQLLWICTKYITISVNKDEWSIDSIIKLLKVSYHDNPENVYTTLSVLIKDTCCEELINKNLSFERDVFSIRGKLYEDVVTSCISVMENISLNGLYISSHSNSYSPQATLYDDFHGDLKDIIAVTHQEFKTYEIWFFKSTDNNFCYENFSESSYAVYLPSFLFEENYIFSNSINLFLGVSESSVKELIIKNCSTIRDLIAGKQEIQRNKLNDKYKYRFQKEIEEDLFNNLCHASGQEYQRMLYSEFRTAIHEAGHAVAGYLFKKDIVGITVVPSENNLGTVCFNDYSPIDYYAGDLAEEIYFNEKYIYPWACGPDFRNATKKTKTEVITETEENGLMQKYIHIDSDELGLKDKESPYVIKETIDRCNIYYNEARKLMVENIDLVEALAKKLMKEKTMCSGEVESFLTGFIGSKNIVQPTNKE